MKRNCVVDPIMGIEEVARIKAVLAGEVKEWKEQASPRDLAIFVAGINNGIRSNDLLAITMGQVREAWESGVIRIKESKTGKANVFVINGSVREALEPLMEAKAADPDHFPVFQNPGRPNPLRVETLNRLVKKWCEIARCRGKYGARSLRKTWGYHARVHHNVPIELIMNRYNHSNIKETMRYIGIVQDEVVNVLMETKV